MRRLQWLGLALASMLLIVVAPASDPAAPHAQDGDSANLTFQRGDLPTILHPPPPQLIPSPQRGRGTG